MASRRAWLASVAFVGLRLAACGIAAPASSAVFAAADPLQRAALPSPRARGAVLLGIARAGGRLVAVGERGVVLLSDDAGASWRQASVPVSTTLTAVSFPMPSIGFAVGHAGVILRSRDGGQTWERQLDGVAAARLVLAAAQGRAAELPGSPQLRANAERLVADGADKPFLDIHFSDASHGWVVGAYGLMLRTTDGGQTWVAWTDRVDNPKGLHLNAIAVRGETIVVAGEQGQIWQSTDGGEHFTTLASPYKGSWFGVAVLPSGRLVVAGLRGNAWYSDDQGARFSQAIVPLPVTISAIVPDTHGAPDGLLALNQAGQVLRSLDRGASFHPVDLPPGAPLTALVSLDGTTAVGTSLRGPRRLTLPPTSKPL